VAQASTPRWWQIRRAQNRKPVSYRCPLCGAPLPSMAPHMLIVPEGDSARRRHAHTACVLAARKRGGLPTREEWQRTQPSTPSRWQGLRSRFTGRSRDR